MLEFKNGTLCLRLKYKGDDDEKGLSLPPHFYNLFFLGYLAYNVNMLPLPYEGAIML